VLTGSIKTLGPDTVGGVATTHFAASFDATRALAHAPKDRQHAVAAALDLMNVDNNAINGEVWLDAAGQPRKVLMRLREKVERRIIVAVNVTAEIDHIGGDPVPIPPRELAAGTTDIGVVAPRITKLISRLGGGGGGAGGGAGI
jgi:hypothetical protein